MQIVEISAILLYINYSYVSINTLNINISNKQKKNQQAGAAGFVAPAVLFVNFLERRFPITK